jgi:alpha-L-fucosidase
VAGGAFQDTKSKPFTAEDFRFTTKGSNVYAIQLAWPSQGRSLIRSLAGAKVQSVELLGSNTALKWHQQADGLEITLPPSRPGKHAHVFRITLL